MIATGRMHVVYSYFRLLLREPLQKEIDMYLARCKDQRNQTLDEFYIEVGQQHLGIGPEGAKAMLELIARLRALPNDRRVYGLTSHHRLCLLAEDAYTPLCFVEVGALDTEHWSIRYLIPISIAPWQNAYVHGSAASVDDAVEKVTIAMDRSERWKY